jgi:uroporphyrinogen-III synthase
MIFRRLGGEINRETERRQSWYSDAQFPFGTEDGMAKKRKTGKKPGAGKSKPATEREAAAQPPKAPPAETPIEGAPEVPPSGRVKRGADFTTLAIWAVAVLSVLAGAGYATRPFWLPTIEAALAPLLGAVPPPSAQVPPQAADDRAIEALEAERTRISSQLAGLMKQVETLEAALADVQKMVVATGQPAAIANQSLIQLSQRLADLERTGSGREDLLRRLAKLEESVSADEGEPPPAVKAAPGEARSVKGPASAMARARAAIEAVQRLRRVVGEAAPYGGELSALKDLVGADKDMGLVLAGLQAHQATGIPTLAALRHRFDDVASAVAAADRVREGDGWSARILNRLSSLIRLRRTGARAPPGSVDGAIAAAEGSLRGGDLKGALEALDGLEGGAARAAAEWMAGARARVMAERALAALHVHAVALLAPARDKLIPRSTDNDL